MAEVVVANPDPKSGARTIPLQVRPTSSHARPKPHPVSESASQTLLNQNPTQKARVQHRPKSDSTQTSEVRTPTPKKPETQT